MLFYRGLWSGRIAESESVHMWAGLLHVSRFSKMFSTVPIATSSGSDSSAYTPTLIVPFSMLLLLWRMCDWNTIFFGFSVVTNDLNTLWQIPWSFGYKLWAACSTLSYVSQVVLWFVSDRNASYILGLNLLLDVAVSVEWVVGVRTTNFFHSMVFLCGILMVHFDRQILTWTLKLTSVLHFG